MAIRAPIIPTEITVHLGPPDEAAPNITVPFTEYIKNVATGEIYPTWPLDAIKANVLAIVSFTLNRVYNEWYPSKGYDFDITSDPAYDQSFVENRQFFETIAQVVDDIFNNYIIKNDQVQPLFARYCDGKQTTCEGLSQWGSVALAQQGKSPLEILQTYYGDDISLVFNAPVAENILSYPGFPVELGTSGDFVRTIKIQLNRIGQNYPALPVITDDSIFFTVETERVVRKFQEIFDLDVTGVVDKATWYKIKYLYNAVKQISDLYSEGISMDEAQLLFQQNLQEGDRGQYIIPLNYMLRAIAYFDSNIPFLEVDREVFGENTKQMLIAFQNQYNLPATGIVDANTWKALKEVYQQTMEKVPRECLMGLNEFYPGRYLSRGMTGDDITELQQFLYLICENTHSIPGVVINGIFDNLTEQSVKTLQKRFGFEQNGVVGPGVWYEIVQLAKQGM